MLISVIFFMEPGFYGAFVTPANLDQPSVKFELLLIRRPVLFLNAVNSLRKNERLVTRLTIPQIRASFWRP